MRPDYGALLHSWGTSSTLRIHFDDVPISEIGLSDAPCLTATINTVVNGIEYAVSFDFTEDAGVQLVSRCSEAVFAGLERAAAATDPGERFVTINPPVRVTLETTLGPLQQSSRETFATFVVQRVG